MDFYTCLIFIFLLLYRKVEELANDLHERKFPTLLRDLRVLSRVAGERGPYVSCHVKM